MELNAIKTIDSNATYAGTKSNDNNVVSAKNEIEGNKSNIHVLEKANDKDKDKDKKMNKEEIVKINEALNDFMGAINSDLHFVVHDRTKEIMMQVVDRRDNKVLKEIPSKEMLDVIANIRDYVGSLLDKRA